jgi:hypothetical protein
VFITFENPQAVNSLTRLTILEKWDVQIKKEDRLKIERAKNPDDILWENRWRRGPIKTILHYIWT